MRITTHSGSVRIQLIAAFTGLALLNACSIEREVFEEEACVTPPRTGDGNIVTTWAGIAGDAIARPIEESTELRTPGPGSILVAQVQLAVYDALVAIEGTYEPFSYSAGHAGRADEDAAAATAAYRILRTRVPGRAAYLDAQYETTMNAVCNGRRKTNGINLGEAVAAHYLVLRANDNLDKAYTWVQPPTGPGVFEPVAPAPPADYQMVFVPPFTFELGQSPSFFPPPPPALTSHEYAVAWREIRDLGRADSTLRTEAQTQLARWATEDFTGWITRNLNELALAKGLDRMEAARFFALVYTSIADAAQTGMSAKYHYNLWRPSHAVPRADTDGNPETTADPTWRPLYDVNHPEYPSGHGFATAGATVAAVRAFFGTDEVSWTLTAIGIPGLTETSRSYTSLTALARDINEARILAGLHYRFSVDAGEAQGAAVVEHIVERFFHRSAATRARAGQGSPSIGEQ